MFLKFQNSSVLLRTMNYGLWFLILILLLYLQTNKCLQEILECLLHMLSKEVIDHCKQSVQYFYVLMAYVKTVSILTAGLLT